MRQRTGPRSRTNKQHPQKQQHPKSQNHNTLPQHHEHNNSKLRTLPLTGLPSRVRQQQQQQHRQHQHRNLRSNRSARGRSTAAAGRSTAGTERQQVWPTQRFSAAGTMMKTSHRNPLIRALWFHPFRRVTPTMFLPTRKFPPSRSSPTRPTELNGFFPRTTTGTKQTSQASTRSRGEACGTERAESAASRRCSGFAVSKQRALHSVSLYMKETPGMSTQISRRRAFATSVCLPSHHFRRRSRIRERSEAQQHRRTGRSRTHSVHRGTSKTRRHSHRSLRRSKRGTGATTRKQASSPRDYTCSLRPLPAKR